MHELQNNPECTQCASKMSSKNVQAGI